MKQFIKVTTVLFILFLSPYKVFADIPHFLDFKYILNQSEAGKKAQIFLKSKLENGAKKLKDKEKALQDEAQHPDGHPQFLHKHSC